VVNVAIANAKVAKLSPWILNLIDEYTRECLMDLRKWLVDTGAKTIYRTRLSVGEPLLRKLQLQGQGRVPQS
jgi:hypothetical protein